MGRCVRCVKIDDAAIACIFEPDAFPNLTRLDLTACNMITSEVSFPPCIHLDGSACHRRRRARCKVHACERCVAQAVIDLVNAIPRLRTLRLGKVTQISERAIDRVSKICRRLEDVSFESCVGCTVEATSQLAMRCTELQSLNLANCPLVDDVTLSAIARCLTGLTFLDLSGCKMITDKLVSQVVRANTALTSLAFYGCPKLGNRTLQVRVTCPVCARSTTLPMLLPLRAKSGLAQQCTVAGCLHACCQ